MVQPWTRCGGCSLTPPSSPGGGILIQLTSLYRILLLIMIETIEDAFGTHNQQDGQAQGQWSKRMFWDRIG